MLGWAVGHSAVAPNSWVTRQELMELLTVFIDESCASLSGQTLPIVSIAPCIYTSYLIQFHALLDVVFHQSAKFYLLKSSEPSLALPTWCLGLFLQYRS